MDNEYQNKIFIQIKIDLTFSNNGDFREVITDCWTGFRDSKVSLDNNDLMSIAVSDIKNDFKTFRLLLERAENAGSAENFKVLVSDALVSSQEIRTHFETVRNTLMAVDESITHSQIWQFLKCLRVVYFDTSNN